MKNQWIEKRTEELRPLLTLIVDNINLHGHMMGASRNKNWHTNERYDFSALGYESKNYKMQGTLDRITKVEYHKCHHTDGKKGDWNPPILGEDIFDHQIRFEWKELFGMGTPDAELADCLKDGCYLQDSVGNWHPPCDTGIWIVLWHPRSQKLQERVSGYWNKHEPPHWRPEYHYTEKEVEDALKIMCHEFDWKYENKKSSCWIST